MGIIYTLKRSVKFLPSFNYARICACDSLKFIFYSAIRTCLNNGYNLISEHVLYSHHTVPCGMFRLIIHIYVMIMFLCKHYSWGADSGACHTQKNIASYFTFINPIKPEFTNVIFIDYSLELLSQFPTCSQWRWLEVSGKWKKDECF